MNILIHRKKIKNLILKIEENGDIIISAPLKISENEIRKFIVSKEKWINIKRKKVLEKYQQETFEDESILLYLGEKYRLKYILKKEKTCYIENDTIYICTSKENSIHNIKKVFEEYAKKTLYDLILEITEKYSKKMGCLPETVKIRKCKRIWGNCRNKTKCVTYNLMLYKKDIRFIEYVVVHELAHLKYPHHQKEFWEFIEQFLPDWKERKKL